MVLTYYAFFTLLATTYQKCQQIHILNSMGIDDEHRAMMSHYFFANMSRRHLHVPLLNSKLFLLLCATTVTATYNITVPEEKYLFDFTKTSDVDNWQEQSDTVRSVGMSKAVFVLHQNSEYRRAIFFALLNPQPNGAGFAGIRSIGNHDLTGSTKLQLLCRGQGQFSGFKVVLRHKGLNDEPNYSFEQYFQAPKDEFGIRSLPFSEFKAYYRGKRVVNNETLDISKVSSIGLQMYGGVYQPIKQKGPATLEIEWIKSV